MANAMEYVDLPDDPQAHEERRRSYLPPLPTPRDDAYIGTIRARQLATVGSIDLTVSYNSGAQEVLIGPFAIEVFEILLLLDDLKEALDNMILDHQAARHIGRKP